MLYFRLNCVAVVLLGLTVGTVEGQSLGRWRLPSTPAQFFGYGYGPGHHAPMVRTPRCTPMSVKRLEVVYPQCGPWSCGTSQDLFFSPAPFGVQTQAVMPLTSGAAEALPVPAN